MTKPGKHYQKHIHRKIQRLATWEPGDAVAVGDIGVVHRGVFRRQTSLEELDIPCEVLPGNKKKDHRSFSSRSGVSLRAEGGAKVPQGFMRIIASLKKAGTVVFEARGVQQLRLGRQPEVVARLRALRDGRGESSGESPGESQIQWDRRWVCIDQVWRVDRGTVLIATGGASEVGMTVRADAVPELEGLASAEILGNVEVRGGEVYRLLGARDFTPLYTAWTFNWWGKQKFLSGGEGASPDDEVPDDQPPPALDIDALLDSWDADATP